MTNKEKLDRILTSKNARCNFYKSTEDNNFAQWLTVLIPELIECKNCTQNTPWHVYNVLDHILVSVEEVNKLTNNMSPKQRKIFSYVMLIHDLGKPKCKQIKQIDGKNFDSFPNHHIESEKIGRRVISDLNFNQQEIDHMALLIHNHDIFTKVVKKPTKPCQQQFSKELLANLVQEFNNYGDGKQILDEIITIAIADNKAQTPQMTKEPLEILNEAKKILNKVINTKESALE